LSTSGPPGTLISIAVIVSGRRAMLELHASSSERHSDPVRGVETRANSCQAAGPFARSEATMDWDELKPKPAKGITLGESLETLSIGELEARVAALEAEIHRVKENVARKKAHEAAAAAVFKR
jgi:uncharacterized small protein (DUF1192 family)